jgi:hypothetical protein
VSDEQVLISRAEYDALRAHSALLSCCVGGFLADGSGPHLAEAEVWQRLRELGEAFAPLSAAPRAAPAARTSTKGEGGVEVDDG